MIKISDLTYKVVAFSEISRFNTDECVDWALEMVALGYNETSLFILAGLSKPTNYFQTIDYLKQALKELKFPILQEDKAVLSCCFYFIKKIASSENIRINLQGLHMLSQSKGYEQLLSDFYLLYWAWNDIDYENESSPYWKNVNSSNIATIVTYTATAWISKNKSYLSQLIHT